jgi:hypothetical protein
MRKLIAFAAAVAVAAMFAGAASAHTTGLSVIAVCNHETGAYDVTWTISVTNISLDPKVFASTRPSIPVGAALGTVTAFTETVDGTSTSLAATVTVRWGSDDYKATSSAAKTLDGNCQKPPAPKCPPDYPIDLGVDHGILRCGKETVVTREVPGPSPPPIEKIVFGTCPSTTKEAATPFGPVCLTAAPTKTVYVNVPGKTKYIDRWHTRVVKIKVCPIPKPCPSGSHRLWDGKKWVCAIEGAG